MPGEYYEQPALLELAPRWREHWQDMPEYRQDNRMPWRSLTVHFERHEDRNAFAELVGQKLTDITPSIWYPAKPPKPRPFAGAVGAREQPKYPIFIPSKGRWASRLTMRSFDETNTPYRVVVEPQEFAEYSAVIHPEKLLVLPFHNLGLVATRHWIWDFAASLGVPFYWTFDDNINGFMRLHDNTKSRCTDGSIFAAIEDFVERYENIAIAGCNYDFFAKQRQRIPPYVLNTRVYSNMLIRTGAPFRNEGFYNDDTDLCLRVLKAGWVTVQFNAFLIKKAQTMTVRGGMTPHYNGDGRLKMAQELAEKHPDVVTITRKFGRWQHQVNYAPFRNNALRRAEPVDAELAPVPADELDAMASENVSDLIEERPQVVAELATDDDFMLTP